MKKFVLQTIVKAGVYAEPTMIAFIATPLADIITERIFYQWY